MKKSEENSARPGTCADKHPSFLSKHKWDAVLISALLAISLALILVFQLTKKDGEYAVVEIEGEQVASYPLYLDGEYKLGSGTNVLVIEGGEAYMTNANCPDRTCEQTGRIRYVGESIICLPNKIAVIIKGDGGVDIVS